MYHSFCVYYTSLLQHIFYIANRQANLTCKHDPSVYAHDCTRFKTGRLHFTDWEVRNCHRTLIKSRLKETLSKMLIQHGPKIMSDVILQLVPEFMDLEIDPEPFLLMMSGDTIDCPLGGRTSTAERNSAAGPSRIIQQGGQ